MNHAPNLTDRIARVLAGAVLGALLILGCKIETGPSIVLIQTIDLAPLAVELPPSHTADLSALSITSRGDTGTVKLHWTTTGGEITDTVNVDGIWHATYLSPATTGTYLVVVTAPSGWPAETTNVTVSATVAPVQTVVVNPDSLSLVVGTSTTLTTTLRDSTGTQVFNRVVTWKTSDPSVASVSLSGLVRTFSPGKATITATSEGKSNTAVVTVTQVPVATVTVTPASQTVFVGGSAQYTVTLKDASGGNIPTSGRVITWSSNAPATASVSNSGLATGFLVGSATITATCEGQSNSATLNIQAVSTTHALLVT